VLRNQGAHTGRELTASRPYITIKNKNETSALFWENYAAYSGNSLPTFRDKNRAHLQGSRIHEIMQRKRKKCTLMDVAMPEDRDAKHNEAENIQKY
jgi:hypothetical protein